MEQYSDMAVQVPRLIELPPMVFKLRGSYRVGEERGSNRVWARSYLLAAVDIHAYRSQEELLIIGVDASTVHETDWQHLEDQPGKLRDLVVRFHGTLTE